MKLLLLNASPHRAASRGYGLAREVIDTLQAREAAADRECVLVERDLSDPPLPPIDAGFASAITARSPDSAPFALSEMLIREIEDADYLVINTPMHNFAVPAALKLWIDHVVRIHRTFESTPAGKVGLMRDRPTFVIVGSGGVHHGPSARQADFLTPYLGYVLGSIGIRNVRFFRLQGLVSDDAAVQLELARERAAIRGCEPFSVPPAACAVASANTDASVED